MKKNILNEINDMKYLFNYNRGKVISEQEQFESAGADLVDNLDMFMDDEDDEDDDINYLKGQFDEEYGYEDMDDDSEMVPSFNPSGEYLGMVGPNGDMEFDEDLIENRELEVPVKPGTKTPTKPKKPGTPYSPKPGPKKNPKARKGNMPDWLSFDELGIDFE